MPCKRPPKAPEANVFLHTLIHDHASSSPAHPSFPSLPTVRFVHMETSADNGHTWTRHPTVEFSGNIIQPSVFVDGSGNIRMLARMTSNTLRTVDFDELR